MAAVDDIYNEITRNSRTRKGRSFFPAANAINSTPQGQTLGVGDSRYGFRALPPDQNPAYQAALSRGRVNRNDMTTVYTPSGGTIQVPNRSLGGTLAAVKGSTVQPKAAFASDYAKGYGAPTPYIANIGAPNQNYQIAGGVANPVENLTPQARVAGGVGGTLDYFRTNPSLNVAVNALRGFGSNIASWFGGGRGSGSGYQPNELNPQRPELAYIPKPAGVGNLVNPPALVRPPAPLGINNLVPPNPYVGRAPNERMFPTGAGGVLPFPSANPGLGTVQMANERFPGNVAPSYNSQYPTPISNPIYNPSLQAQGQPRRYSDLGYY